MNSKSVWVIAGIVVGGALLGAAHLSAEKPVKAPEVAAPKVAKPTGQVVPGFAQVGRYTVVKHDAFNNIILLDTATGDVYKVTPKDFKEYSDRPRGSGRILVMPVLKDEGKKVEEEKKAPKEDEKKTAKDVRKDK